MRPYTKTQMIEEIESEFKKIFDRMKEDVKEKSQRADGTMYLEVDIDNCLLIKIEGLENILGLINRFGDCYMLNTEGRRKAWQYWYENGMKVDDTPVSWRGKEYSIKYKKWLYSKFEKQEEHIYNFKDCKPFSDCSDENIKRYPNGTPILY